MSSNQSGVKFLDRPDFFAGSQSREGSPIESKTNRFGGCGIGHWELAAFHRRCKICEDGRDRQRQVREPGRGRRQGEGAATRDP